MTPVKKVRFCCVVLMLASLHLLGQEQSSDSVFDTSSRTFLTLPLIMNNPAFETGFGLVPMYFFKFDKDDEVSPPSMVSALGLYSTNKSYVFMGMARLYWDEDKNRANVAFGPTRVNYDFEYELDGSVPFRLVYSELRSFILLEYSRKIVGDFYLGALYLGTQTNYRFDQGSDEQMSLQKNSLKRTGSKIISFPV